MREARGGEPAAVMKRFWAKVTYDDPDDCWIWMSSFTKGGYGAFGLSGRQMPAHRFSYEAFVKRIPDGFDIDHLCRNHRCVNPDHLEPVTRAENLLRGLNANRMKQECPKGHPYEPANTYRRPNGVRECRTCRKKPHRRAA